MRVPPFFENLGKRLVKSPKVYWVDSGLACHLLGLETRASLERSPFIGAVFEGFVASEILKQQVHLGRRRELYHFRDEQGLEVDFVVPAADGSLELVEATWTRTVMPAMAKPLVRLKAAIASRPATGWIVTRGPAGATRTVVPGVRTLGAEAFFSGR